MAEHKVKRILYLAFGWAQALVGVVFIYAENYNTACWSFLVSIMAATIVQKIDVILSMFYWQEVSDELLASMTLKAVKLERALNEAEKKERA